MKLSVMSMFLSVLAATFVITACGEQVAEPGPTYRVMSFNIMCSVCDFDYDPWLDRVQEFGDVFARLQPDLMGLQEFILAEEVGQVMAEAPGFAAVYFTETKDYYTYPDAVIAYKTARFDLLESGAYWLSPTPDVAGSMGFSDGQDIPRIVYWAHLKDKEFDQELYFATTHFDAVHPAQEFSAPLMLERTALWAETMPVIATGDFNLEPDHDAFKVLTEGVDGTGFHFDETFGRVSAFQTPTNVDPVPEWKPENLIDHVLTGDGNWRVNEWIVDLYKYGPNTMFPSDHRAILAEVELIKQPR